MNRGGRGGGGKSREGEDGTISGVDCPPGLHGIFCKVNNVFDFLVIFSLDMEYSL